MMMMIIIMIMMKYPYCDEDIDFFDFGIDRHSLDVHALMDGKRFKNRLYSIIAGSGDRIELDLADAWKKTHPISISSCCELDTCLFIIRIRV